jgi:ABC-type sugar transport system ATPase subunit
MPAIRLIDVKKSYGSVEVCRAINLDIADREFVTLLGPSGCGKTTTLNMIGGLDQVTEGDIFMDGKRVNDFEPIDRDVAMVFQNYALYPHMTVGENIGFNLRLRGIPLAEINARVASTAASLDLGALLDRYPAQLSGGQQQRVAIGRAIVRKPSVFLFDEPFSNLDASLRSHMRGEVKELHNRLGVTSIFVTHDQEEALSISDRIAIMRHGKIEQVGSPEEVYSRPATTYVAKFIGHPQLEILPLKLIEEGNSAYAAVGEARFALRDAQTEALRANRNDLEVSIRPEHIQLGSAGIPCIVRDVQPIGPSTLVRVEWNGGTAIARLNGIVRLAVGERVKALFDTDHFLFFDSSNGKRIATHAMRDPHEILT